MTDFDDGESELTLEKVMDKLHREIGKAVKNIGSDLYDIPTITSDFLQGWRRNRFDNTVYIREPPIGYEDLVEKAKTLFEQADDIWHEKGYRDSNSLLTLNEHIAVGSSGNISSYFEELRNRCWSF